MGVEVEPAKHGSFDDARFTESRLGAGEGCQEVGTQAQMGCRVGVDVIPRNETGTILGQQSCGRELASMDHSMKQGFLKPVSCF